MKKYKFLVFIIPLVFALLCICGEPEYSFAAEPSLVGTWTGSVKEPPFIGDRQGQLTIDIASDTETSNNGAHILEGTVTLSGFVSCFTQGVFPYNSAFWGGWSDINGYGRIRAKGEYFSQTDVTFDVSYDFKQINITFAYFTDRDNDTCLRLTSGTLTKKTKEPPPGDESDIVLIEPNGGETIASGSLYTITWDDKAQAATFTLGFSTNKGKKWKKIESGITGTAYHWIVPTPNKNLINCLIKVTAFDSAEKKLGADKSDAPFAIEVLTLTTPNGGEAIASGSSYNVSWDTNDTNNPVDHVKIFCSTSGGKKKKKKKWTLMATEPGNPGISTCEFPVPKKNITNCLIKAVAYDYTGAIVAQDQSDRPFTIEVLRVISPNGGETLKAGNVVSIDWETHQTVKEVVKVVLKYSFKGGKKWKTIETITGDNPGTYLWTVPAVPEEKSRCKVVVQLKDEKGKGIGSDTSDSYFTVQP